MPKNKKFVPFESPYKVIRYQMVPVGKTEPVEAIIEILDDSEIDKQKEIRSKFNRNNVENEKTQKRVDNVYQRLFEAETEDDVLKYIGWAKSWTLCPNFRYRTFAYLLSNKLDLFEEKEKEHIQRMINCLNEHGCIHPEIIDAMYIVCGEEIENRKKANEIAETKKEEETSEFEQMKIF